MGTNWRVSGAVADTQERVPPHGLAREAFDVTASQDRTD